MMTPAKKEAATRRIRRLYYSDNLPVLREMDDSCVDLIYLDPPFNSDRNYNAVFLGKEKTARERQDGRRQIQAFEDTWKWQSPLCDDLLKETAAVSVGAGKILSCFVDGLGKVPMTAYLVNMGARLVELQRVLNSCGSLYLHCDYIADSYLRVLLDSIFGPQNFQNEFIWYYSGGGASTRRWARKHDVLLFYTKGKKWTFNSDAVRVPHKWDKGQLRADGSTRDYEKGKIADDVFQHHSVMPWSNERTGYPTQKPRTLLERIIKASSNEGDIVLDPFCGCGTCPLAAELLNRQWIGIDIAYRAVGVLRHRFTKEDGGILPTFRRDVEIIDEPKTADELDEKTKSSEAKKRKEFEVYCIIQLGGIPNTTMGPDGGVDGRIPIAGYPGCYAIVEVKSGGATIDDLRALSDLTRQNKHEPVGILVLRECPPMTLKKWRNEAQKRGVWNRIPRLQVMTLPDILRDAPMGFQPA